MKERALQLLKVIEAEIASNRLILPSLPEVAIKVRQLLADPNSSVMALEQQLGKDAAMTARLLKVANSSSMSRGMPVTSLRQAIMKLGMALVGSLVTQMAILQTMRKHSDDSRLEGFVASSLQISSLCHEIARKHRHLDPELASLGGLLHDIGKLPLREYLAKSTVFTEAECQQLELVLHPHVGALLLKRWQMAAELVQMAFEHERILRDSGGEQPDYVDVVIAANLAHYGTLEGRYTTYHEQVVPAVCKCFPEGGLEELSGEAEQRMEMALELLEN